ncbi:hypothetical protein [Methanoculleus sp. 7T]|uniref:hypothetical protein n=1 Tax=Methanoculleus sp. 7T TaxID=2937282 RepID=UPI0020BE59EC|nr:hypothetical protein [Methanoculleus sp. 7T]MCK8519843.1 hypothetical protein [Methanoculleus sp. 7T]
MEDTEKILAYLREKLDQCKAERDQLFKEGMKDPGNKDLLAQMSTAGGKMIAYNDVIVKIQIDQFKP